MPLQQENVHLQYSTREKTYLVNSKRPYPLGNAPKDARFWDDDRGKSKKCRVTLQHM